MKIALLCPTMGRPHIIPTMIESLFKTANVGNLFLYLGLTEGETEIEKYIEISKAATARGLKTNIYQFPDWTLPMCHNELSKIAMQHEIHFGVGDDSIFATPGWDEAVIEAYEKLENKIHVFSLLDNRDHEGMPAPIITRAYIEAMGWRIPPYFMHWYCDTWTTEIAKANNCLTHLKDYLLIHDKKAEQGVTDGTWSRIRSRGGIDRDHYIASRCSHFLEIEINRLKGHFLIKSEDC